MKEERTRKNEKTRRGENLNVMNDEGKTGAGESLFPGEVAAECVF